MPRLPSIQQPLCLTSHVPGFQLFPHFATGSVLKSLEQQSIALQRTLRDLAASGMSKRTHISKQHNLTSEESYQLIGVPNPGKKVYAQYFKCYGMEGHELTYFIDNDNVPNYVHSELIRRVTQLPAVAALQTGEGRLRWNFTMNAYSVQHLSSAEFPFHIDTSSNGDISLIFSLLASAELLMRKEETVYSFELTPGSLVLLSGESRWVWEHRVVPMPANLPNNSLYRMSLVLGSKFHPQKPALLDEGIKP